MVRHRTKYERDETKKFLDTILSQIPFAVIVKDAKTRRFLLVNRAFETMLEMSQGDLLGKTVFDIYRDKVAELVD